VVAHGSRVEGFANRESDLDFWVVSPIGAPPPLIPVFDWVADYHLQPESYSIETLMAVKRRVDMLEIKDGSALLSFPIDDLDIYYRCASSIPLRNVQHAQELKSHFDRKRVAEILAGRYAVAASTEREKARVFRALEDELEESLCLARCVEFAVDSFLARNGEAYPNRKWRFEKLRRFSGPASPQYRAAWNLKSIGAKRSVDEFRLACDAFLETLAPLRAAAPVRPQRTQPAQSFRVGPRDLLFVPQTAVYDISGAAHVWRAIDGKRTFDEIVSTVTDEIRASLPEARQYVASVIKQLRARGLVELGPLGYDR
jgi:predicted nucleotidyltransferase